MISQILIRIDKSKDSGLFKKVKTIVLLCLTFFIVGGSFLNIHAQDVPEEYSDFCIQGTTYFGSLKAIQEHNEDPDPNVESLSASQILALLDSGLIFLYPEASCNYDQIVANPDIPLDSKAGVIGIIDSNIYALLTSPPTVDVPNYLAREWVPGYKEENTSVYAQDGFSYLQSIGVDTLSERTRVLGYTVFVVILAIAGFMIMFRTRIGGQLIVSVFNTLPNIILGLILVTFSFAIIGLLIDIGAVITGVIGTILQSGLGGAGLIYVDEPFDLFQVFSRGANLIKTGGVVGASGLIGALVTAIIISIPTGGLPAAAGGTLALFGGAIAVIVFLVIFGLVGFASIRVYITLIKAYIGLIIDTIMINIYIPIGSLPGRSSIISDAFKRIIKNILTFPIVFLFINLSLYILNSGIEVIFPGQLSGAGVGESPATGVVVGFLLKVILALYLFFVAADAPKFLDEFLPQVGGKGGQAVQQSLSQRLGNIPVLGSLFK